MMSNSLRPKIEDRLRVGLVIESLMQPRWVRRIIEEITKLPFAQIEVIVKIDSSDKAAIGRLAAINRDWKRLLYQAYSWIDDAVFSPAGSAFEKVSVADLVGGIALIEVTPIQQESELHFCENDVDSIRRFGLDVALAFGLPRLNGDVLNVAKHGVWAYLHDVDAAGNSNPPGFWEVMNQKPISESALTILSDEPANDRIIYESHAPTLTQFSVVLNKNSYYWKSAGFVTRKLQDLYRKGEAGINSVGAKPGSRIHRGALKIPGNYEMGRLSVKLGTRAIRRAFEKLTSSDQWCLAYKITPPSDVSNGGSDEFKYLIPPHDRFWADPFPIKFNDKHYVFFEEFIYANGKAHLSVIELSDKGIADGPTTVLEQNCHLSYPFIFEWLGNFYMIPETGEKNAVELYRASSFPFVWEFEKVLLKATNPLDATLVQTEGRWWMFVSIEEKGVAVNWDELHLFYAESPLGPWKAHECNPVKSDVRSARSAGRLFWSNNILYRPSQDSTMRYGYGITINEVVHISAEQYIEKEAFKILPNWDKRIIGVHTLNACEDITVIDCLIKRRKFAREKPLAAADIGIELTNQGYQDRGRGLRA